MEVAADSIGDRIKMVRQEVHYTQEDFADTLGLSRNYVCQVENGRKTPTDKTISRISRTFRVNQNWLERGTGNMHGKIDPYLVGKVEEMIEGGRFSALLLNTVLTNLNDKELDVLDDVLRKLAITEQHLY